MFSVQTDGSDFQLLHNFSGGSNGGHPASEVTLADSQLFGTSSSGGGSGFGTVYSINTDGTDFRVLHSFTGNFDGSVPLAGLTLVGSTLFGTSSGTTTGGLTGTVFSIDIDGSNYRVLHRFAINDPNGFQPKSGLTVVDSRLYGTTTQIGSLFSMRLDGSDYRVEHQFQGGANDGLSPRGDLLLLGTTLYGATGSGGPSNQGTLYAFTVPEPSTIALAAFGLIGLAAWGWRRKR